MRAFERSHAFANAVASYHEHAGSPLAWTSTWPVSHGLTAEDVLELFGFGALARLASFTPADSNLENLTRPIKHHLLAARVLPFEAASFFYWLSSEQVPRRTCWSACQLVSLGLESHPLSRGVVEYTSSPQPACIIYSSWSSTKRAELPLSRPPWRGTASRPAWPGRSLR